MTTRLTTTTVAAGPVDSDALAGAPGVNSQIETQPISPHEAGASLEKLLQNRSEAKELKDKNILRDGGNLAAQREALERSILEDKLSASLERRPTADELVDQGILNKDEAPPVHADSTALQGDVPTLTPSN